ncbi:MAG: HK97 family phage prohead protease [Deltaproteobacteria bacterium]|nr:HK97 family phage prohead protease [Deltaproteobacteria bacterium]
MSKKIIKQCHGTVIPLEVSDLNENGRFEGYATVYGVPIERMFGTVIMDPGLFSESLQKKGAGEIRMLWQHDSDQPIGVYERITEDSKGVRVEGRLLIEDIPRAREAYALMKHRAIGGLSVGFGVEETKTNEKTGVVHYTKADLWEVSAVTFPANSQSKIERVHSLTLEEIKTERDLERFLREAGLSRSNAKKVALHGFSGLHQREADEDYQEVFKALEQFTKEIRKGI